MEAKLFKKLHNGKIICTACSQACILNEGEYGKCGVRQVKNGTLDLLVYGKVGAIHVDPVEKKPLYHFLPNSKTLSLGTVGCNFTCSFCQNYELSQSPKNEQHNIFGKNASVELIVELAKKHKCESISYTYNEPIIFFEYNYDIAKLAKKNGLKNIYVTSGYETNNALDTIQPYLNGMNIDLKSFNDEFYKDICGGRLKPVLECIKHAHSLGIHVEITTLFIPTLNDSEEEMKKIAEFIASVDINIPWHVSAFHPTYKMINLPRTSSSILYKAYNIGIEYGLKYVYVGNLNSPKHTSTYCPNCHSIVIERQGHLGEKVINHLNGSTCKKCGHEIYGVWV